MIGQVDAGDTAWVLTSSALVMLMLPGLALFYGGMVRGKNVLSTLMHSFFALAVVTVLWVVVGYSLTFGPEKWGLIGGLDFAGLQMVDTTPSEFASTVPKLAFMVFQMMFAIITPALISGSIAERMKFSAYVWFIGLWALLVYFPIAHWVFAPEGWIYELGALDFAGGTVVHINAGIAGLVAAIVLGKRKGWPREPMLPHNLSLTVLGAGMLWFGWFGFNAGSALGANELAAQALINTHLAAAAGMLGWLVVERLKDGHPTTLGGASGAVAGLVAITPCAGFVGGLSPLVIGSVAGGACYLAIQMKTRLGYDDSLDVVGVHLVGGVVGSILLGFFSDKGVNALGADGVFFGGTDLLVNQVIAVLATIVFSGSVSLVLAKVIDALVGLRITPDEEDQGMDTSLHAETAYALGGRMA